MTLVRIIAALAAALSLSAAAQNYPSKPVRLIVAFAPATTSDIIGRMHPDAFFAKSVLLCEGASEVGLARGIDQHRSAAGKVPLTANGVALVDCGGGETMACSSAV